MTLETMVELMEGCSGKTIDLPVDLCVIQDNDSAKALKNANRLKRGRLAVVVDQVVPPNSPFVSQVHKGLIEFAGNNHVPLFYGRGMSAWLLCEKLAKPGQVIVSCDPTAAAAGAAGAFGFCVTEKVMEEVLAEGILKIKKPEIHRITLKGALRRGAEAKDLGMMMVRELGWNACEQQILAISGKAIKNLSIAQRITIGAVLQKTGAYLSYFADGTSGNPGDSFDLDQVEAQAALPGSYREIIRVSRLKYTKINSVFIGGTAGGSLEDIKTTAMLLKGREVSYKVCLTVAPATADIYVRACDLGYITDIMKAGGLVINQCGNPEIQGRIGEREVRVSNDLENCTGYGGDGSSETYITNTEIAVMAGVTGYLGCMKNAGADDMAEERSLVIEGRCWKFGDDIDTDIIIPTQHLTYETMEEIKAHAFEPLRPELAALFRKGDIIVGGSNFGCGSSREQAAEVIVASGIHCIIAKSFARIFFRNGINNGILLLECQGLPDEVKEGDIIRVELERQIILANGREYPISSIAENLYRIIMDGGLVKNITKNAQKEFLQ